MAYTLLMEGRTSEQRMELDEFLAGPYDAEVRRRRAEELSALAEVGGQVERVTA